MDPIYQTRFSSALLTGVFAGIAATLFCMVYYLLFKEITGFPFSSLINVSSLIFVINLLFVIIGLIYSFFVRFSRKGEVMFIILFIMLTALSLYAAMHAYRSSDSLLNHEFQELLAGIVAILGISAFVFIPILFHNRKFLDKVL